MSLLGLLKSLAPGFLPLFGYIAADLVFGETASLFIGIGIGALEFLLSFLKEKKADLFIAADTILLSAMGLLSLLLRNRLFFRLKPAVMEGFVALAMAILLLLPRDLLKTYMGHQVKGLVLEDGAMPALRGNLALMTAVFVIHAGLTVWAALFASTALWGFVSGGLLYLLLGAVLLARWLGARKANKAKSAGPASLPLSWCLLVFDGEGKIYAAKTPRGSEGVPVWDSPVRGIAAKAADMETAVGRGLASLGLDLAPAVAGAALPVRLAFVLSPDGELRSLSGTGGQSSLSSILELGGEKEDFVFAISVPPSAFPRGLDPTERRFWRPSDLAALMGSGRLAPAFEREIGALLSQRTSLRGGYGAGIVSAINDAIV